MLFDPPLIKGKLIQRYKRFLADVEIHTESGPKIVTAHCPNTGSMRHCLVSRSECWISESDNPKRKLAYTLEAVTAEFGGIAGVNTARTNKLVKEALIEKSIPELANYQKLESEVKFGQKNSRLDFRLSDAQARSSDDDQCLVEVKNVTLGLGKGVGAFPDAVTERGLKHLHELAFAREQGHRAVLFFCVQHTGIERVKPAWDVDVEYCTTLLEVVEQGVEVLVYGVSMTPNEFRINRQLDFDLAQPSGSG